MENDLVQERWMHEPCRPGFRVEDIFGIDTVMPIPLSVSSSVKNGRLIGKAQLNRRRPGGGNNFVESFLEKQKNMHWRSYWRLRWF